MDAEWACHLLFVPVRESWFGNAGPVHGRHGRHAVGTAGRAAFSSEASPLSVQGSGQQLIRLQGQAAGGMLQPIGADHGGLALPAGAVRAICQTRRATSRCLCRAAPTGGDPK
jgi:hypothetical protein